ncbi:hypothetical protein [Luteimonas sp. MHLX1A]|uniref:hypothetical protein n=1 Tax=Alterluteimonas muca TaxID=2878684 RepID=UPI001E3DCD8C|nr:hypothetical protein [Luteimonas sp. MHLX1A]MCD9046863.1 hypothetical protein [Luteimonas sp. MHLX1A]
MSKLAVFGSYLTDAPVLGDIDVAFDVERVVRRADVERDGTCVYDFFAQSSRRLAKTKVALRLRRPEKMSLHRYDELKSLGTPYRDLI